MTRPVVLIQVEATKIQEYIFSSNNLRQNAGASELIARAATDLLVETLTSLGLTGNASWEERHARLVLEKQTPEGPPVHSIANHNTDVEIVYTGGGNALIIMEGDGRERILGFARTFTEQLARRIRGVNFIIEWMTLDWDNQSLAQVHGALRRTIAKRKLDAHPGVPLLGLGVTATCDFTGLPAVDWDPDGRRVSVTAKQRYQAFNDAETHLKCVIDPRPFLFEYNFDRFGKKHESSYIAVVHADGNRMGQRFAAIAHAHPNPGDNAAYVIQLRALSDGVNEAATGALRQTVQTLTANLARDETDGKEKFGGVVPLHREGSEAYLPFRPIVFGGDDVTFVSEGRLGLALATEYLKALSKSSLPGARAGDKQEPLYARAGVAIVKSHYPFSRAYALAEELADSAKQELQTSSPDTYINGWVMDWHISTTGLVLELDRLREREYVSEQEASLLLRPVWVGDTPVAVKTPWKTWHNAEGVTRAFQSDPEWTGRRNKSKALRDALRAGPEAVTLFRSKYKVAELPALAGVTEKNGKVRERGWLMPVQESNGDKKANEQEMNCPYFDPLEATDFYVSLKGEA